MKALELSLVLGVGSSLFPAASSNNSIESPGNPVPCEPSLWALYRCLLMRRCLPVLLLKVEVSTTGAWCFSAMLPSSKYVNCTVEVLHSSLSLAERVKLPLTRLGQGNQIPLQKRRLSLHFGSPISVSMYCMILIACQRPFRLGLQ
ncbi:hypothetical protein GE21DRAFT_1009762 [Neurospora crassa]|nr:hypothetical protein GE21DRAFT_1009762 [Neurospora crassa]